MANAVQTQLPVGPESEPKRDCNRAEEPPMIMILQKKREEEEAEKRNSGQVSR